MASSRILFLSLVILGCALPGGVKAQFTLVEGDGASLELGGYLRTLTGLYDLGYELQDTEKTSAFNAEVVRLKWVAHLGESAVLEVHDRIQLQTSSSLLETGGSVAGFGVSAVPGRSVELSSDILKRDRIRVWHDVDRLSLTLYSGLGDITLGRQAITWGISNLFPVSDLWAQFSPFELDTEEKPGIDAIRLLTYPGDGLELDAVVADRGSAENLSAGVRAGFARSWGDLYVGGGKFWNQAMALAGVAAPVGSWKIRVEGVLPYHLDRDEMEDPRLTAGLDWFRGETLFSAEYHFNGAGKGSAEGYGEALEDPRFTRGETYYLGRHYLGGLATWTPGNDRLSLTLSALSNLQDPSAALTPVVSYDFGQNTRASAGALLSLGEAPSTGPLPELRSEYGTYGDLLFTRISIYF